MKKIKNIYGETYEVSQDTENNSSQSNKTEELWTLEEVEKACSLVGESNKFLSKLKSLEELK